MANLPNVETPAGAGAKKRRSWFTPGKAPVAFQLAIQPPSPEVIPISLDHVEILTLTHFTRPPKVDFGTVRQGETAIRYLKVHNPNDYNLEVTVEKCGGDFSLSDMEFEVEGLEDFMVTVEWNPTTVGGHREVVLFKVDGVFRLQATLMGKMEEPPKPKKVRKIWAEKPFVPVRQVLRTTNMGNNTNPAPQKNKPKQRSMPSKPPAKRASKHGNGKPKTPPNKTQVSDPKPKQQQQQHALSYVNPQQPLNPVAVIFEKRAMPEGPVDSPVDPRRTTFEKSSPEMQNTPVISEKTPPQSMRENLLQPRRILLNKPLSPLASEDMADNNQENLPPLAFCDEGTPLTCRPRSKNKMRRSNTYTKLNNSSLQKTPDSEIDTIVIEKNEIIETVEVTEHTEVQEEVIKVEEQIEYLIEDNGIRKTCTEVSKSLNPVGRQIFSNQAETNMTFQIRHEAFNATHVSYGQSAFDATEVIDHQSTRDGAGVGGRPSAFDATKVLGRCSDMSFANDNRMSIAVPPGCATFIKSPLTRGPKVLSETHVLSPHGVGKLDLKESYPLLKGTDAAYGSTVLTPIPASPRRFFSDLLALHDSKEENESQEEKFVDCATQLKLGAENCLPNQHPCCMSSLTVTKERPSWSFKDPAYVSRTDLFENVESVQDPRRFSTLTVTKNKPTNVFEPQKNAEDPRRMSSLTVTKESSILSQHTPSMPGRCLFSSPSPKAQHVTAADSTPHSPGVCPLDDSPSPHKRTPKKIRIEGTSYPNMRSLGKLEADMFHSSPSPRKQVMTPSPRKGMNHEKTRRRTSGQFRRRSNTYQVDGSLVARGLSSRTDEIVIDSDHSVGSSLTIPESGKEGSGKKAAEHVEQYVVLREPPKAKPTGRKFTQPPKALRPVPRKEPLKKDVPASHEVRPPVKPRATAAQNVPSYLRPTSAVKNRTRAVSNGKKRELSVDRKKMQTKSKVTQEPASKKIKCEAPVETQSVVSGLTKTQALRRGAALSHRTKEIKRKTPPRPKKVAQSKLKLFAGAPKTALPKHPMAFAAKNKYYDERWMEKQERGFVRWLNFVLTPPEDESASSNKQKVDACALVMNATQSKPQPAPTKETLSLRVYSARRRLNRLRRQACKLYTSDTMVHFEQKLEIEIELQRIMVRQDRKMHADVGIKQCILDLLLSYNPLWLRIGIETVYGEMLPITSNADFMGMSRFILTRLLADPDIASEYAHPSVPHLYRDGYQERLSQFTLKHFLLLVVFLDKAKMSRLIDHDPCLFCPNSDYKASRDLLLIFSRDYLSGEGDLTKHLGYLGYTVQHSQTPHDELDYAVENLAVDLRDGTRLTRVMSMITKQWELTKELRVPAISRLQKIHNVGIAFRTLQQNGMEMDTVRGDNIDPRDIADGHREKTLSLLWQIIFRFQVDMMLNEEQLRDEIHFLRSNLSIQTKLEAINDDLGILGIPKSQRESLDSENLYFESPRLSLLLKWCRAVCAYYNVKVENFTVSFSDGRVLCHLVHHYHPGLLRLSDINNDTTQTVGPGAHNVSLNSDSEDSFSEPLYSSFNPNLWDNLLTNERENFRVLYDCVNELGNIPVMVRSGDMSNTIPDEKVVITYVSYLCARLIDIRHETRAARVIQMAWKKYKLKKEQELCKERYEARSTAIVIIQTHIRAFLGRQRMNCRRAAILQIQTWWRMVSAQQRYLRQYQAAVAIQQSYRARKQAQQQRAEYLTVRSAIISIQALVRGYLVKQSMKEKQVAAVKLQSWWRMVRCQLALEKEIAAVKVQSWWKMVKCQQTYMAQRKAAIVIQHQFRACQLGRHQCQEFHRFKEAVSLIEQAYIKLKSRRLEQQHQAALIIQKCWRGFTCRQSIQEQHVAATCIKHWYKAMCERRQFCRKRRAAICIQTLVRCWIVRRQYTEKQTAAVTLQSWLRMVQAKRIYQLKKSSSIIIQRAIRAQAQAKQARSIFLDKKNAAITLQRAFRAKKARFVKKQNASATVIQGQWRSYIAKRDYIQKKTAAVRIQSVYRAYRQRQEYCRLRVASVCIQSRWRSCQVRKNIQLQNQAAVRIQSWWHMVKVQRMYVIHRVAALTLQDHFRAYRLGKAQRTVYLRQKTAAVTIQAMWRAFSNARKFNEVKQSVIVIQQWFRARQQHIRFSQLRTSTVCIQSHVRSWLIRQQLKKQIRGAIRIQSIWRMYTEKQAYRSKLNAVVTIQSHLRATLQARRQQEEFQKLRSAAVKLQRAFLERKSRIAIRHNRAATMIQVWWLMQTARHTYKKQRSAALVLQRWMRTWQQRCEYLQLREAAVCIQSHVKCWLVRHRMHRWRKAATELQAWWRMVSHRKAYYEKVRAVITLQWQVRAYLIGKRDRAEYIETKSATVTIQKTWKAYCIRKQYLQQKQAALKLQTWHRERRQRVQYCKLKESTVCLQQYVRAWLTGRQQRQAYLTQRRAAVVLQAAFRGRLQRKKLTTQRQSAVTIQSAWRMFIERTTFLRLKRAVSVIEHYYKATVAAREAATQFTMKRQSAVKIQAIWRAFTERRYYLHQRHSTIVIQSHVRRFIQHRKYQKLQNAALYIQRWYRAEKLRQKDQRDFFIKLGAIITLQAGIRGWKVRCWFSVIKKLHHAAITVQSSVRMHQARQRYKCQRQAAITIQRRYRAYVSGSMQHCNYHIMRGACLIIQAHVKGWLQKLHYQKMKRSALIIQAQYRCWSSRRRYIQYREEQHWQYLRMRAAVTIIAHHYKARVAMKQQRAQFLRQKQAAITIQSAMRGLLARRELYKLKELKEFETQNNAVTCIQAHFRRYRQQCSFIQLRTATVILQKRYRARLSMRQQQIEYQCTKKATITLQTALRSYLARQTVHKLRQEKELTVRTVAATVIQSHFRQFHQQRQMKCLRAAVVVTQHYYRARLAMRYHRNHFLHQKKAAVTIQSTVRGYLVRQELARRQEAAIRIQSAYKAVLARRRFCTVRISACRIQAFYRACILQRQAVRNLHMYKVAAIVIQSAYRGFVCRQELLNKHRSATVINSAFRCFLARREFHRVKSAVVLIQQMYRACVLQKRAVKQFKTYKKAAVLVQSAYRGYLSRRRITQWQKSATVIQSMFRAYRAREEFRTVRAATVTLQKWYRNCQIMKQQRSLYMATKRSAIVIQSVIRGYLTRRGIQRQVYGATKIQAIYRGYRCWKVYMAMKKELHQQQTAAVIIQRVFRRFHKRKIQRIERKRRAVYLQKVSMVTKRYIAVVQIQRAFRRYKALQQAKRQIHAVLIIQRWMRGRLAHLQYLRLRQEEALRHLAATRIQVSVRDWLARRRYIKAVHGVIRIQSLWRGWKVRKHQKCVKIRAVRRKIEAATANVTEEKKLGYMTTGALDFLLHCKQLSTILVTLMKLEPATRWSSVCCEQMAATNAADILFQLIRSCNRSVPHIDIITYCLDILLNLTKYENTSSYVYKADRSITTLVRLLTIFREKGSIFQKTCTLLGLLSYPEHHRQEVLAIPRIPEQIQSIHSLTVRKYRMDNARNLAKTKMAAMKSFSGYAPLTALDFCIQRIEPEWLLRRQSLREMATPLQAIDFLMNALRLAPK